MISLEIREMKAGETSTSISVSISTSITGREGLSRFLPNGSLIRSLRESDVGNLREVRCSERGAAEVAVAAAEMG